MKLRKGDKVRILAGKDRGRRGVIERVFPKQNKVLVKGVNIYKKHIKSRGKNQPGGIVEVTRPLSAAKVILVCPDCKRSTRQRVCRQCGKLING